MVFRLDPSEWVVPTVFGLIAVMVGVLAGFQPLAAIAAAGAVALLLVTLTSLTAGLVGFVALSFLELVPSLTGPAVSLAKLAGAVLFISWLASVAAEGFRRKEFPVVHPGLMMGFAVLLGWNTMSVVWAEDETRITLASLSFFLSFALFPIVYAAIRTKADVRHVFAAFVIGSTLAALYGYVSQPNAADLASSPTAAAGLNRLAGTFEDPNEFATLLVTGIALSAAFIFNDRVGAGPRVLAAGAATMLIFGVLLTLSRGGLVSLAAVVVVAGLVLHRHRAKTIMAGVTVIAAVLLFFAANPEAAERVTNSDGGSGRTDIWKIGWRMVEDKPVVGVGAGNFQVSSIHYLIQPGGIRFDEYVVDVPAVSHNMYLQVLAELGIVGFVLFMAILLTCISMMWRAYRTFTAADDREGELLAAATMMATSALMAGYFFLAEEHSKHLWLLLAMGPALLAVAKRNAAAADERA